jgi:F0F1-type ATP synthase assembly protein I
MIEDQSKRSDRKQNILNISMAIVAGQVGCITLVVILIAVLAGLWLDNLYQSKPAFTIGFLLGSIPLSLALMFFVVRAAVRRIKVNPKDSKPAEEE